MRENHRGIFAVMSCRAWLLIAAIGLAFQAQAFAQGLPEQPLGQQTEGERQQQQQGGTASWGFPVRIIEEPEQSESARRQEREAVQREVEGLEAQKRAADSASGGFWVSVIQAVLSFFGAVLLFVTLLLNWRATKAAIAAANAAVDGAKAAVEGAKVTRDTLTAQFRPRIRVGIITMGQKDGPPFAQGEPINVNVDIVNIGNFAARICESHCEICVRKRLPMNRPYQGKKGWRIFKCQSLEPGMSIWDSVRIDESLSQYQVSSIRGGSLKLFVMGYVRYRDPNGTPRRTMFCRVYCPSDGRLKPTEDPDYEVEN